MGYNMFRIHWLNDNANTIQYSFQMMKRKTNFRYQFKARKLWFIPKCYMRKLKFQKIPLNSHMGVLDIYALRTSNIRIGTRVSYFQQLNEEKLWILESFGNSEKLAQFSWLIYEDDCISLWLTKNMWNLSIHGISCIEPHEHSQWWWKLWTANNLSENFRMQCMQRQRTRNN